MTAPTQPTAGIRVELGKRRKVGGPDGLIVDVALDLLGHAQPAVDAALVPAFA